MLTYNNNLYQNQQRSLELPDQTHDTHIHRIRQEMPATTSQLYFNAGTFGPLPTSALQAMQQRLQGEYTQGRLGAAAWEAIHAIYDNARRSVAHLLNADVSEIALTGNTGEGMNIVRAMKSLRPTMSTIMHSGHSTRYVIGSALHSALPI